MKPSNEDSAAPPPASRPATAGSGHALDESIIRSLCYADIFGFPMTLDELVRYAIETNTTAAAVSERLTSGAALGRIVKCDGELFYLDGRAENCQRRRDRAIESGKQLEISLRRLIPLQGMPFIRSAAITGALAALNSPPGDDVDLLIITAPGRTWTTYFFLRLWRRFGHNPDICFNMFLSEGDLTLDSENLFYAREVLGAMPVLDTGSAFARLVEVNSWISRFYPSFNAAPERQRIRLARSPRWLRRQRRLESLLRGSMGDLLEAFVRRVQTRSFLSSNPEAAAGMRPNLIKLHRHDNRPPIIEKFEQRTRERIAAYRQLAGPPLKSVK